jgi:hypothetical protein
MSRDRAWRLDCGPFTAFAGDAASPDAEALVRSAPIEWTTPEARGWRGLLERLFADRIRGTSFVALSTASLDVRVLERLARVISSGYEVGRPDAAHAGRLLTDMGKDWLLESYPR